MLESSSTARDPHQELTSGEKTILAGFLLGLLSLIPRLLAGFVSGSVILFTDVIRSGTETLSQGFSFLCLRKIRKSRTNAFEYGMGKLENMAGLLTAGAMMTGVVVMSYASIQVTVQGDNPLSTSEQRISAGHG